MLYSAFQEVEKNKKFTSKVAKDFTSTFSKQTAKLIKIIKGK